MAAVAVLLAITTVLALAMTGIVRGDREHAPAARSSIDGVAPSPLPEPAQSAPAGRVDEVHRALHAMGRACRTASADRGVDEVRRPVAAMLRFARDYPDAGFRVDDESGSTLSLLVVLRNEVQTCDPTLVLAVDELLPAEFRDPG